METILITALVIIGIPLGIFASLRAYNMGFGSYEKVGRIKHGQTGGKITIAYGQLKDNSYVNNKGEISGNETPLNPFVGIINSWFGLRYLGYPWASDYTYSFPHPIMEEDPITGKVTMKLLTGDDAKTNHVRHIQDYPVFLPGAETSNRAPLDCLSILVVEAVNTTKMLGAGNYYEILKQFVADAMREHFLGLTFDKALKLKASDGATGESLREKILALNNQIPGLANDIGLEDYLGIKISTFNIKYIAISDGNFREELEKLSILALTTTKENNALVKVATAERKAAEQKAIGIKAIEKSKAAGINSIVDAEGKIALAIANTSVQSLTFMPKGGIEVNL
ncbi:MAG: hypothetical protein OEZ01_17995 [Candidatus Heimdallarchaeota archaeon]|nr:hypothetical protein [Candidatus Nomurabacteria bacterium]MDH5647907.1 hypothetical protein [Candidatus Heimdallarchaeota archaeon]